MSSNKLAAIVRRTILPIFISACADLPTATPEIKQQGTETPVANNYRPRVIRQLTPAQAILGGEDLDAKGIQYSCAETVSSNTRTLAKSLAQGSTVTDTLALAQAEAPQWHNYACTAIAQNDTVFERDSVLVPAKPAVIPPAPGSLLNSQEIVNGKTREQRFYDLVNSLYGQAKHLAEVRTMNGAPVLVVPWYKVSNSSLESDLHDDLVGNATYNLFPMVSDEHSEVGIVTAMANNESRMRAALNGYKAMKLPSGLVSWRVKVETKDNNTIIYPVANDAASDADARYVQMLYICAGNPSFSEGLRAECRTEGNSLAYAMHDKEFGSLTAESPSTGRQYARVISGGPNTASGDKQMWGGYIGDIIKAFAAAYKSTNDVKFREAALDATSQQMDATVDPKRPSFPYEHFRWESRNGVLTAVPNNYFSSSAEAMGSHDGVRWLNADDALRTLEHAGLGEHDVVSKFRAWISALRPVVSPTLETTCIQGMKDGTARNCGSGPYQNGLGTGMVLHDANAYRAKLDRGLQGFTDVRGVYEPIRIIKALGAGIGKEFSAY